MRIAKVKRKTKETDILIELNIDGRGKGEMDTGIGFFDHMLNLMAFHASFDLKVICKGDLYIDDHHTVEDIGIALGQAFYEAIGDRLGIKRYSSMYIPMDEALGLVVVDISNRPYLIFNVDFNGDRLGTMSTQNFKEFFRAFADKAGITLHINSLYGENDHHVIEGIFKAFSRALKDASQIVSEDIPSSKGIL
jgi:imidazoleglycerol-phosphate dehydratase